MNNLRSITPKVFLASAFTCLYVVMLLDQYILGLRWFYLLAQALIETLLIMTHPIGVVATAVGMTIFHLISFSVVVDKVDLEAASFYATGPLFLVLFLTSYLSLVSLPNIANFFGLPLLNNSLMNADIHGHLFSQMATVFFAFILTALAYLTLIVTISTLYRKRKKNIK